MEIKCLYCSHEWTTSGNAICKCPICEQVNISPSSTRKMPHEILQDIIGACGVRVLSDKTRMQGLLADLVLNKILRKIILLAIHDNIHEKLINNSNNDIIKIESIKYFFSIQNFLYKEIADYIVDSFAYALGNVDCIDLSKLISDWFADNSRKSNFSIYATVKPVKIVEFSIVDDKIIENIPFDIQYKTLNANRAYINNEEIPISKSEYRTQISGYRQFVLTVENEHYKETQTLEVQPIKLPQIYGFMANETYIKSGEDVVLSWSVVNASRITIKYDNQEIDVRHICDVIIPQTNTTQYELVAYTMGNSYSKSMKIQVIVIKPAQILYFRSNKERVFESDKILLTWEVTNARKILLLPLQKDVTKLRQIEILSTQSEKYTLQVSNELFTEEKSVLIYVHKLPIISKISLLEIPAFNIDLPNLNIGAPYISSILKQLQKASWYNNLFSMQFKPMYILIDNILSDLNKRLFNIIKAIKK